MLGLKPHYRQSKAIISQTHLFCFASIILDINNLKLLKKESSVSSVTSLFLSYQKGKKKGRNKSTILQYMNVENIPVF